jgi:hypothetical protein
MVSHKFLLTFNQLVMNDNISHIQDHFLDTISKLFKLSTFFTIKKKLQQKQCFMSIPKQHKESEFELSQRLKIE